jgi:hypothetical protein
MIDGTIHHVQTVYADGVAYEMTAAKHKWPAAPVASMHALAFVSWHALRRTGDVPNTTTFEAFRDEILQVQPLNNTDEVTADPTGPGQQPGS